MEAEKKRKREAKDTAGSKWFDMPATQMTPEIETTLKLMKVIADVSWKSADS